MSFLVCQERVRLVLVFSLYVSDTDEVGCLCIAGQESRQETVRDVMAALLPLAAALVSNV